MKFSHGPGNAKDWIGLYREGASNRSYVDWAYVNGSQTATKGYTDGTVTFKGRLKPGTYHLRFFKNDSYTKISQDVPITVTSKKTSSQSPVKLKMLTMNTWHGGGKVNNGTDKIVRAVQRSGADVVGFQERPDPAKTVAKQLGWHFYQSPNGGSIISRYPIVEKFEIPGASAPTVRVRLSSGQEAIVTSAHLDYKEYGPYSAHFENKKTSEIIKIEEKRRGVEAAAILRTLKPYLSSNMPVFLLGDFNAPSHLDWVDSTKKSHNGYTIEWPVSKKIKQAGMTDSYRKIHPDPAKSPGNTWSPVYTSDHPWDSAYDYEPQDRIDFIYSKGRANATQSQVFVTGSPKPYGQHKDNEWPSDHAGVLSTFTINP
ncbi:endonuclease/exonuclease/phosphatase family protein [Salinithrix halophila]|uniref:Endonuclease/exonuclease/phosphatase family protein n=1 Tax=Salinithrix halophila TaxID=1485204 RepID=A0ABV8JAT8_9BACL